MDSSDCPTLPEEEKVDSKNFSLDDGAGGNNKPVNIIDVDAKGDYNIAHTSPAQLHDVTMDNSYSIGYRSPTKLNLLTTNGSTSPLGHGRSVREFEEQMASLKKENFNLKLRIYFLEEKYPGFNTAEGQESMIKQYIDNKVDIEVLSKDLNEKQLLLMEAAQAMNHMENMAKESEKKNQDIIEELQQRIQMLEIENEKCLQNIETNSTESNLMNNIIGHSEITTNDIDTLQKVRELEATIQQYEERSTELNQQIEVLESTISKKDEIINSTEKRLKLLDFQNAELQEQIEQKVDVTAAERKFIELNKDLKKLNTVQTKYKDISDKLTIDNDKLMKQVNELKINLNIERRSSDERKLKIDEQEKFMNDMHQTIYKNRKLICYLTKQLEGLEKKLIETNYQKECMQKEIFKLRGFKINFDSNMNKRQFLSGRSPGTQLHQNKNYLLNPLFCGKQFDENSASEYKLKEKICNALNNGSQLRIQSLRSSSKQNVSDTDVDSPRMKRINSNLNLIPSIFGTNSDDSLVKLRSSNSDTSLISSKPDSSCQSYFNAGSPHNREFQSATSSEEMPSGKSSENNINYEESSEEIKLRKEVSEEWKYHKLKIDLDHSKAELADKLCALNDLESELKKKEISHEQNLRTVQKLFTKIEKLEGAKLSWENNFTQAKENVGVSRSMSDTEGIAVRNQLREKDKEIAKLKENVKKKTINLQTLVNKELWDKNREIERLTKLLNNSSQSNSLNNLQDFEQLQQSFTETEYQDALERNIALQEKVDSLIQKLAETNKKNLNPSENIIKQLYLEIEDAKNNAAVAEKWREECSDVCQILTSRLEELAGFLDTLLKQKDVLNAIASDRRNAMRKAIDSSLDLSKSLNQHASFSRLSMNESSLLQLSNITSFLSTSNLNQLQEANKTFNSHEDLVKDPFNQLSHQRESILVEKLKTEIKCLKKELDKHNNDSSKKDRRSLPMNIADNQSESEAWSEPDRKVSLARIGLEEAFSRGNSVKKSNLNEIESSDIDGRDSSIRPSKGKHDKIQQLEEMIVDKEQKIIQIQCELVDADNRFKEENLKLLNIQKSIANYQKMNEKLQEDLISKKISEEKMKQIIEEKSIVVDKLQKDRDDLLIKTTRYEHKLDSFKKQIEEHEERLNLTKKEHEESYNLLLSAQESKYIQQTKLIETKLCEALEQIVLLNENEIDLKTKLNESEKQIRSLKQSLDESTLSASKAVLERTKALNEKAQLEGQIQSTEKLLIALKNEKTDLQSKFEQLENTNLFLHKMTLNQKIVGQQSLGGYTSEELNAVPLNSNNLKCSPQKPLQRLNNSSPDLGIESDNGRVSSFEVATVQAANLLKTIEFNSNNGESSNEDNNKENTPKNLNTNQINQKDLSQIFNEPDHECSKVYIENNNLKQKLERTKRQLKDTLKQLRTSNQRKEEVEREIRQQIVKTHNVLKTVRTNMETELHIHHHHHQHPQE